MARGQKKIPLDQGTGAAPERVPLFVVGDHQADPRIRIRRVRFSELHRACRRSGNPGDSHRRDKRQQGQKLLHVLPPPLRSLGHLLAAVFPRSAPANISTGRNSLGRAIRMDESRGYPAGVIPAPSLSRRLAVCLAALATLALVSAGRASAGYGVAPSNGARVPVTAGSSGAIASPASLDLVVYLDAEDSAPLVWVSESPAVGPTGSPAAGTVASCPGSSLLPFGEPNKWVCRVSTIRMQPGRTYYWWLDFSRQDPGASVSTTRISGPFSFSLVQQPATSPAVPPAVPPANQGPQAGVSTKTVDSAARLPGGNRFDGRRSIKHVPLTTLVYRTMKALGLPRQLAFACWNKADWVSVLAAEGGAPTNGDLELQGFWLGRQPRWLHLAPHVCTDVQRLLSTKLPNARRAG